MDMLESSNLTPEDQVKPQENSEKVDSGMDEDSQHSTNSIKFNACSDDSSDEDDIVQTTRRKTHRLIDDDIDSEDSRPPIDATKSDMKDGNTTVMKTASEALEDILNSKSDVEDNINSDVEDSSDDNETLLNTINRKKKKKKIVQEIGSDDSDAEDTASRKSGEPTKSGNVFGNGDLFDAEDSEHSNSDSNRNSGDELASDSKSEGEDEGFDENSIDPKLLKKLKKGAAKKDPSQTARGKRKAKEEALLNMHSETQRIVREAQVKLPYHQPSPRSLQDFLGRAKSKQEQYKAMRGARDIQKAKLLQDIIEKSKRSSKQKDSSQRKSSEKVPDVSEKSSIQSADKSEEISKRLCVNEDSIQENTSSQKLDTGEESSSPTGEDIEMKDDDLPDLDEPNGQETFTDNINKESADSKCVNSSSQDVEDNTDCVIDTQGTTSHHEKPQSKDCEIKSIEKNADTFKDGQFDNTETIRDSQLDNTETVKDSQLYDSDRQMDQLNSSEQCEDTNCESKNTTNKSLLELIPDLPSLPKLSGDPYSVISFEDNDSQKNPGVLKLMDRFMKHSKKKEKKREAVDIDISIVQKDTTDNNRQELKESTFTYHVNQEEENPLKKLNAPGAKLIALKSQLQVKMKARREEARQKRQEVYELDNEEGFEAEDAVLDDEAELTDQSDTDEEENFEEQFGEEETEEEEDERKEENPFMDDEAEEEDDGDDDNGDDEELNLCLNLSDDEDKNSDEDEGDLNTSITKKKARVLHISDDEESKDIAETNEDTVKEKADNMPAPAVPFFQTPADDSLEDDSMISPFSKHLSSTATSQRRLSLAIEDSQDLYGATQNPPATAVITQTQSHGIHFFVDDSQSQMLDDDGFLKMGSSTKKPAKSAINFSNQDSSQDNMDELMGLCSGRFVGTEADEKKSSCKSLFGLQSSQINNTQGNMDEFLGLCSGRFVESDKNGSQSGKKRKCPSNDDDDADNEESDVEEFDIKSDDEDLVNPDQDKVEFSDDDKENENEEEMEDEDEEEETVYKKQQFSGFTVGNAHGKIRQEFVDEEAELSGSEFESDEDLDLALEDDILEMEEGDKDQQVGEEELRNQVGRAHLKQLIDEDKRELMRFQEMYLPDGDLHSEGGGRTRKFRWKDVDDDTQQDLFGNDSDGEKEEEEGETDFKWRKERFEREKWLQEQEDNANGPNENSQFLKLGQVFLKRRDSNSGNVNTKKTQVEAVNTNKKKEAPNTPSSIAKLSNQKRGSFLSRDKHSLAKIAEMSKSKTLNTTGARNSGNFVFQVISPDKDKAESMPAPTVGKKTRKAHTPKIVSSQKPAAKKPRLEKSFSQNSIFNHM